MTEEEFCKRFVERVKLRCRTGRKPFGMDPETYGKNVASIYWREMGHDHSPEQCVDHDAAYW